MKNYRWTNTAKSMMLLVFVALHACAKEPQATNHYDNTGLKSMTINNLMQPNDKVLTSGQPTQDEFVALAEAGVKHIVNLRPASEQNWNEAEYIASLGMTYTHIPVGSGADLSLTNAQALNDLLTKTGDEQVLVHCKSGNRVGALAAIAEGQLHGKDVEQAIAEGKRWGLTGLESTVRSLLE